jgi:hypothetical protein
MGMCAAASSGTASARKLSVGASTAIALSAIAVRAHAVVVFWSTMLLHVTIRILRPLIPTGAVLFTRRAAASAPAHTSGVLRMALLSPAMTMTTTGPGPAAWAAAMPRAAASAAVASATSVIALRRDCWKIWSMNLLLEVRTSVRG